MIFSLFGGRLVVLRLRHCKGECIWIRLCASILLGNVLRSVIGKTDGGGGVRSNQFISCT